MKILAVDTALDACSVAVMDGAAVLAHCSEARTRGHAEVLMPMLEAARRAAGVAFADLDRFAVTVGPGTFTGIRVGVAAVRGLALATGRPAAGVTTLAALAEAAGAALAVGETLVAAIDARRDEVYHQRFVRTLEGARPTSAPARSALPALAAALAGTDAPPPAHGGLVGSGAPLLAVRLGGQVGAAWRVIDGEVPDARIVARLAARLTLREIEAPPVPLYLRPADAKLPSRP